MKPVDWSPTAYLGLQNNLAYYAEYSQSAALRLARKVDAAVLTLSVLAEAGRARGRYRTYAVPSTKIVLIYRVEPNRIKIAACVDGRQNWQSRF